LASRIKITTQNGITINYDNKRIDLDPVRKSNGDYKFISHAHMDHMGGKNSNGSIIASEETVFLAAQRGVKLKLATNIPKDITLVNSGHILGSRGIILDEGKIFYTGDFAVKPRAFLRGCDHKECNILIIESTFGKKDFIFPSISDIQEKVNQLISELFSRGIPVILMGYSLGKAQILSHLFSSWDPIYVEKSVWEMNKAHINLGVDIREDLILYDIAKHGGFLQKRPWVLISPMQNRYNNFVSNLKKKYGAITVAFSGWSVDPRYKYKIKADHAFPLSDHSDFNELVDMAKRCNPNRIYTVHGFAEEFAAHLRSIGFDARPLSSGQSAISEYFFDG
jgi:putative mRNA 3-end processing factor|tara:strand:+ start:2581 stop:3591 length:1011 start_codon:yes stop_codon:yes gene_type:complete